MKFLKRLSNNVKISVLRRPSLIRGVPFQGNIIHYSFLILIFILGLTACGDSKPKVDYNGMAKELCTCMQPLANLYQEVIEAANQQDTARMEALVVEFEKISNQGELCAEHLEKKYGDFAGPEEEAKAKAAMQKACPHIVEMMEGGVGDE